MGFTYDVNGNITSLKRYGGYENQSLPDEMDILSYTYNASSNLLVKVADDGQDNTGFVDSANNTGNDYTYDDNDFRVNDFEKVFYEETERSSMISDKNKGITEIRYNHLSLPTFITFTNGDHIVYKYNAAGQKISKFVSSVNTNNTVKEVEYLDGFQYTGGELNFFPHAGGYVNVTLGTTGNRIFNYVYYYTDHLGNIRLTFTQDDISKGLKILDENHYYPFGLKHQKYTPAGALDLKAIDETTARPGYVTRTDYQYKYNGKEWQDELGLNMYDMDMRQYDPAIARWVVLDPVIHHSMSPYNAFDNNPVFWADPSGADAISAFPDRNLDTFGTTDSMEISQVKEAQAFAEFSERMEKLFPNAKSEGNNSSQSPNNPNNGDPQVLINDSDFTISFKPEKTMTVDGKKYDNNGSYELKPGEIWEHGFDGVAAPHISVGSVYKVNNGVSVTVTNDDVNPHWFGSGSFFAKLGTFIGGKDGGGWKNENWLKYQSSTVNLNQTMTNSGNIQTTTVWDRSNTGGDKSWVEVFNSSGLKNACDYNRVYTNINYLPTYVKPKL